MVKLLLIAVVLLLPAVTISQTITLSAKQVTLPAAFAEIKKQTNYAVVFNPRVIDTLATISISVKNQPLESFLKAILAKQSLHYRIVGTSIIVTRKENKPSASGNDNDDDPVILVPDDMHGFIFEKGNKPLSGVSVVLKRTGKGTQTDARGKFSLKGVGDKDTIVCSMIGYQTTSAPAVKGEFPVVVTMTVAVSELDMAVVQAYGITSKRLATGNITRISGEEIQKQPVMNPLLALQGRVPGLFITPTQGYASAPVKVEIRGRNSVNKDFSGEPLYIIDDVPLSVLDVKNVQPNEYGVSKGYAQGGLSVTGGQSPLFGLNPKDIESIEVLQDGDATAIYGSRAANGVIIITTKKARAGKTTFSLDIGQGITDVPRHIKMLNTQEYLNIRREAFKNDGITPTVLNAPDLMLWDTTRYTDWQKELLSTGKTTNINAQVSGGDIRNTFRLSTFYSTQKGMLTKTGKDEAGGVSLTAIHRSQDQKLNISVTASYNFTFVDAVVFRGQYDLPPNAPAIYDSKGDLNFSGWGGTTTDILYPFQSLRRPSTSRTNNLRSSARISYELMDGLTLSATAGYNTSQNSNELFQLIASLHPSEASQGGFAAFGNTKASNWSVEPSLVYSKFIGRGKLEILAGASLQTEATNLMTTLGFGYNNDDLIGSISNAAGSQSTDGYGQYKYVAGFGRINYNLANKYILNLNGRRDGSSRFADGRQFGNFGSVGAAWILSEENWMKNVMPAWASFVKLRTSYGLTGSDKIGDYEYLSQWSVSPPGSFYSLFNYNGMRPYIPIHAVNQQYHWEENKKFEAALNLGFLKDRISLELVYYRNVSDDQLVMQPTPVFSGFPNVRANSPAKVENTGLSANLIAKLIQKKDLTLNAQFNIGVNRNKLLAYPGLETSPHASLYMIGQSLNAVYLLHYLGIDPLTGNYSYVDNNKDGEISANASNIPGSMKDDRYIILDRNPEFEGSFRTDLLYKNFSLGLSFFFRKQQLADPFLSKSPGVRANLYLPGDELSKYWRKPGDIAQYPRFSTTAVGDLSSSDGYYTEGSFLRLNNISISYSLPDKLIKKAGLQSCRFSVNMNNIFTITRYKGIDPDVLDLSGPPPPRVIFGSLSFTF